MDSDVLHTTMRATTRLTRASRERLRCSISAIVLACLVLGSACARPAGSQTSANPPTSDQAAPFHPSPASASDRTLAIPQDSKPASAVPFHAVQPCILPSGTFLTVKLDRSLVPGGVHAGDPFLAAVAGPIQIDGHTVIDSGTQVTGRVESAQASSPRLDRSTIPGMNRGKGYVQLTLTAIVVDGKQLPLQTASLFARGTSPQSNPSSRRIDTDAQSESDIVRVQKGRRLTFRLIAPITVDEPHAVATLNAPKE
jgi:hypothetical protein